MIDWERVATLRDEVGVDEFDEVIELFLEEVDAGIHRLTTEGASSTLAEDLHFLKGSAMSLGFRSFSQMCQAGETSAGNGGLANVNVDEIVSCYAISRKTFLTDIQDKLPC